MGRVLRSAAAVILCSAAAAQAQESAPLPTPDQLRTQVEAGEYRPALQGLLRVLNLKGPAAAGYDRHEMLMLRAECQLQVRSPAAALEALATAQKEAAAKGDSDKMGAAMAMTLLIQRSPQMKYTPKSTTGPLAKKPIDILDRKARPEAYKALFEDELTTVRPKVRAAEAATRLPPVMEAAKLAGGLRALEKAATDDVTQTKEMTDSLGNHAALLLSNGVTDLSLKTDAIAAKANTIVTSPILHRDPTRNEARLVDASHRRGLDGQDMQALKTIQSNCGQVTTAAGELSLVLPGQAAAFKDSATQAEAVKAKATAVLNDDYSAIAPVPITPNLPIRPGGVIGR